MTEDKHGHDIEDIDCIEAIDKLYAWLDGEIDDAESVVKLEHHLEHCHSCFTRSELEKKLTERIRDAGRKDTPASLQNRLKGIIDKF